MITTESLLMMELLSVAIRVAVHAASRAATPAAIHVASERQKMCVADEERNAPI
jgi:hypothetical protein